MAKKRGEPVIHRPGNFNCLKYIFQIVDYKHCASLSLRDIQPIRAWNPE
jgi:hypothetical protein